MRLNRAIAFEEWGQAVQDLELEHQEIEDTLRTQHEAALLRIRDAESALYQHLSNAAPSKLTETWLMSMRYHLDIGDFTPENIRRGLEAVPPGLAPDVPELLRALNSYATKQFLAERRLA